jgi:hypothetical protein
MRIIIETIPHEQHRYPTVGDWRLGAWDGDSLHIYVSEMGDWRHEVLVAFHEFAEATLCKHRGIPEKAVDEFDIAYELERAEGDESEPGDDPAAPYYWEHQFSTCLERLLAGQLDVDWTTYNAAVESLP